MLDCGNPPVQKVCLFRRLAGILNGKESLSGAELSIGDLLAQVAVRCFSASFQQYQFHLRMNAVTERMTQRESFRQVFVSKVLATVFLNS